MLNHLTATFKPIKLFAYVPQNHSSQRIHPQRVPRRRRHLLANASAAFGAPTILNFPIFGKAAPSNKVIVAVMGVNSRGAYLAKCYSQLPNVEVAYICDVEDKAIQNGLNALKDAPRKPGIVSDIRSSFSKRISTR